MFIATAIIIKHKVWINQSKAPHEYDDGPSWHVLKKTGVAVAMFRGLSGHTHVLWHVISSVLNYSCNFWANTLISPFDIITSNKMAETKLQTARRCEDQDLSRPMALLV